MSATCFADNVEYPIYIPMTHSLISNYTESFKCLRFDYMGRGILNDYHVIYEIPKTNIPLMIFHIDQFEIQAFVEDFNIELKWRYDFKHFVGHMNNKYKTV